VRNWTLLTNHAQVLLAIARDPGIRLRDIAATLGSSERHAYAIVTDLADAGYVAKRKDGRRNRYQIQAHLPLPGPAGQQATIGELLDLFTSQHQATPLVAAPPGDVALALPAPSWRQRAGGRLPG
jgi:hypothetical protein